MSDREWERTLREVAQPLKSKVNELWNRSVVRRLDFRVVQCGPENQPSAGETSER